MRIICNDRLLKNSFAIYKELEGLITILTLIIRLYSLDFDTELSFDLEIELCESIDSFTLDEYGLNPDIMGKIICKDDEIARLIL